MLIRDSCSETSPIPNQHAQRSTFNEPFLAVRWLALSCTTAPFACDWGLIGDWCGTDWGLWLGTLIGDSDCAHIQPESPTQESPILTGYNEASNYYWGFIRWGFSMVISIIIGDSFVGDSGNQCADCPLPLLFWMLASAPFFSRMFVIARWELVTACKEWVSLPTAVRTISIV